MKKELTPQEIKFKLDFKGQYDEEYKVPELEDAYKKVGRALNIDKDGYNLYLIDSFSKDKLKKLTKYIEEQYSCLEPPKDICYVVLEDDKKPESLFVENGNGKKLKDTVESIKESYIDVIEEFYSSSSEGEKDTLIDEIQNKRNNYVSELMDMAKEEGFDVKATTKGFAFIPLKNGEIMTEKEYDGLEKDAKEKIVSKASVLKKKAELVLDKLKDVEVKSMKKLKDIYSEFLTEHMEDFKDDALLEFINDDSAYEYLERLFVEIEKEIVNCYTMDIDEDEEELNQAINKYNVQVLVDNSMNTHPPVIFEEDPSINNLMGFIEYENHNGVYTTDISLINAGTVLKANEGCLILRINALATNSYSYYYLKKALMSNKVTYDTSKGYVEFMSINGLKPEPIPLKLKVIIIGDYETYDALYNADEDFRKLFHLRAEFDTMVDMNDNVSMYLKKYLDNQIKENNLMPLEEDGSKEILKYLSRKASSKSKINIDDFDIDKLIILANNYSKDKGDKAITRESILKIAYEGEKVEEEFIKMYLEKKILISVNEKKVGSINALAVLDTGYHSFGKPMRVTCIAYKGSGRIIDIHKESHLSGKIHEKSINILEGLLYNILNPYEEIPVDFHLSFEQIYGLIEGDSASVAESICLLSALSKRPIRQNIAVTGSLNQFGEVQPIGGVNEKIEGFYKVCKLVDTIENKGVLVPNSNRDEIILIPEVEEAIERGDFHIYVMNTLDDAIETMILNEGETIEGFFETIKGEIKKYKSKNDD
ncbi:AAA family ATPase [Clostridium sp.]|uniref:AAA family ATPase n=1 Tax=Clostridium sp. TaxID=1506 RepID=UPI003F3A6F83